MAVYGEVGRKLNPQLPGSAGGLPSPPAPGGATLDHSSSQEHATGAPTPPAAAPAGTARPDDDLIAGRAVAATGHDPLTGLDAPEEYEAMEKALLEGDLADGEEVDAQGTADNRPSKTARDRVDRLGLEVLLPDFERPPTGDQVTEAEYAEMLKEAEKDHEWGILDFAKRYTIGQFKDPENTNLRRFKDQWIEDHKTTIQVVARRHGIPPEVLAGIAWTEVGGMPDIADPITHFVRSHTGLGKDPSLTSAGDVSIQLRHISKMEGLDSNSFVDRNRILRDLDNEAYNLDVVAQHARDLLNKAYSNKASSTLSDVQVEMLGYMYNLGYPNKFLSPGGEQDATVPEAVTKYGPDLVRKLERMRGLLGLE